MYVCICPCVGSGLSASGVHGSQKVESHMVAGHPCGPLPEQFATLSSLFILQFCLNKTFVDVYGRSQLYFIYFFLFYFNTS